jgi:23S rRNA pseudouridine1911/1915/1917 synthase
MWLLNMVQVAKGFTGAYRSHARLGSLQSVATLAMNSINVNSHSQVLSSVDHLSDTLALSLSKGGTDGVALLLATAALKSSDSSQAVPVLDALSATSWVDVVQKAAGLQGDDRGRAGKASSCFNVLLSELGRSRGLESSSGSQEAVPALSELERSRGLESSSGSQETVPESRAALAAAVLNAMRDPKNGCLPDVVAFSAAACACTAAGKHDMANEILDLGAAASGRRPGEKRVRVRRQPTKGWKKEQHSDYECLDEGVKIIFEDDHLVVAFKPPGLLVHRVEGTPAKEKSLCEIIVSSGRTLSSIGPSHAAGVTHRLDKGTSGLIVLAKTNSAHAALVMTFFRRLASKTYLALTAKSPDPAGSGGVQKGRIDLPLDGRPAVSEWALVRTLHGSSAATPIASVIKVTTSTGRKHQVCTRQILKAYQAFEFTIFAIPIFTVFFFEIRCDDTSLPGSVAIFCWTPSTARARAGARNPKAGTSGLTKPSLKTCVKRWQLFQSLLRSPKKALWWILFGAESSSCMLSLFASRTRLCQVSTVLLV